MNDVTKLPKWAQTEIAVLKRRVKDLEDRIVAIGNPEKALVVATESLSHRGSDIGLGADCRVRFYIGENRRDSYQPYIEVHRNYHSIGGWIDIMSGWGSLVIRPQANNFAMVRAENL